MSASLPVPVLVPVVPALNGALVSSALPSAAPAPVPQMGVVLTGLTPVAGFAAAAVRQGLADPIALVDFTLERVRQYRALVVPFRSHHSRLWDHRAVLFEFLRMGGRVFLQADAPIPWLSDAVWEDRPGRNYWWVTKPEMASGTPMDPSHAAYMGMRSPHECWHARGAYTKLPRGAHIIQQNPSGETLTWQTAQYGGLLLVTTLNPLPDAEPGIQRVTAFDHYCDQLAGWLLDRRPAPRPKPIGSAVNLFSFATVDEALSKGV